MRVDWLMLGVLVTTWPAFGQPNGAEFEAYELKTFDGRTVSAELGRLNVPESRVNRTSKQVRLAFVRLPGRGERLGPPIIFLSGGPGVPATVMGKVPVYQSLFDRLRQVADVILLDQRGTGLSEPSLQCLPTVDELPTNVFLTRQHGISALKRLVSDCVENCRSRGIDLSVYTTEAIADDIEDLRKALKVDQVQLLGFSYGADLALAVIDRYPGRVARAVLVSPDGPGRALALPGAWDTVLRNLSVPASTAADSTSSRPDLLRELESLNARVRKEPVAISIKNRKTGRDVRLTLGDMGVRLVVLRLLGDGRAVVKLSAVISTALRGDYLLLSDEIEEAYNGLLSGLSGMQLAVSCSGGFPRFWRSRVEAESAKSPMGDVKNLLLDSEICSLIGGGSQENSQVPVVWSAIPTLIIAGSLDANSPPFLAQELAWNLPNSTLVVVTNGFHETLPAQEVQALVTEFFQGNDISGRQIRFPRPRFLSVEEAKAARGKRGY